MTRPSRSWPRIGFCATAYGDVDALRPEEKTLVERAPAARRAEFAAGRACARGALHAAGVDAAEVPLLPDEHGAVRWPGGTIGSITHTTGWTGAVAGRRTGWGGISSLGLDAEQAEPLEGGVLDVIASPAERDRVRSLADADHSVPWSVVLFAAKEAAFKAAYPLTGRVLDHDEIRVELSATGFSAVVAAFPGRALRVRGRWVLGHRVVVALGTLSSARGVLPLASGDRLAPQPGQGPLV